MCITRKGGSLDRDRWHAGVGVSLSGGGYT